MMLIGIGFGAGAIFHASQREPSVPPMSIPVVNSQPAAPPPKPKPLTLEDIHVTVIRVGVDVTLLLDWKPNTTAAPFHLWIEVDGSDVFLHSPGNTPRSIEVVPDETLMFFGSTLYNELTDNRLVIDLQVQKSEN